MLDFRKTSLVGIAMVGMAVAAEVVARIDDWIRYEVAPWSSPNYDIDLRVVDSLGVRGRPHGRYQQFSLNNFGFRSNRDVSKLPPVGCVRVMTLGASQTLGYLEPPGEEFPAELERILRAKGKCYEVLNAGIAGMSLPSITHTWDHFWRGFRPDFVVLYPSPTPYLGESPPRPPRSTELRRTDAPWPAFSLKPRLWHRAKEAIEYPDAIQRLRTEKWVKEALGRIPADSIWDSIPVSRLELYAADLDLLARKIEGSGSTILLLTHATRFPAPLEAEDIEGVNAWRAQYPRATPRVLLGFDREAAKVTRGLAAKRGYNLVDIACELTGRREYFGDPIHFTAPGAAKVAQAIAVAIESSQNGGQRIVPPVCTESVSQSPAGGLSLKSWDSVR